MKKLLLSLLVVVLSFSFAISQRTITGTVLDEAQIPIIGANVVVQGTTTGAITDFDGKFSVEVPNDATALEVSYTGYETQIIPLTTASVYSIALLEGNLLGEVVVTALGIEKEAKTLGYAVDQLKSEELTKARSTNIVNSMQGKVTGVTINNTSGNLGGSSKIIIRGATSLSGRNNPLWVVDGVPINDDQFVSGSRISGNRDFGNGASVINPDDVESMSVLKGAAATALYGSRAAAGAIIVTTKKGKANKSGNASVTFNSSVRLDELFITPDYQQDYAMGAQAKYDSSSVGFDWGPLNVGQTVNSLPITGETGPLQKIPNNGVDDFFSRGRTFINNVSISDGSEKMDYRLSLGALNQTGVVPGATLNRYNIGLNTGVKHSKRLSSRYGVQIIKQLSTGTAAAGANDPNIIGLGSFSSTLDQRLYQPWIDEAGNQINQLTPISNNPYWIRNENRNDRDDTRFLANMSLKYNLLKGLDLAAVFGYDYDIDNRFLSNRKGTAQRVDGDYFVDKINNTQLNTDITANYNTDITSNFKVNVLAGYNFNRRLRTSENISGTSLSVPELFAPGNTAQVVAGRTYRDHILMGVYSAVDLTYNDYLTLSLTGRNDWSSTLPLDNNSYFYPSASLAFVFSEAFNIQNNVFNYGKFRASYAQVGNDTNPYQLDQVFNPITTATGQYGLNLNFPFGGALAFAKSNTLAPADLRPERQTSIEVGAELDFFDYRLGLDIAYFQTQTKDQILALPIPESTAFASRVTNVGQVNVSGFEIALDATPVKVGSFQWTTGINYSNAKVVVASLTDEVDEVLIASAFNSVQVVAVQDGGFELAGIPFLRDSATGRPLINPADGTRLAGERTTFGSVLPDFNMGFLNTFSFGGLDVSFLIDWRSGGVMKSSTVEDLQTGGLVTETLVNRGGTFIDAEGLIDNGDGTFRDNDIPLANAQAFWTSLDDNSVAEAFIFDASFVKLREVAVSYTFDSSIFGNSIVKGLSIGLESRNTALLWSVVPHVDPENTLFGSGADGFGVERSSVPSTRSYGINLRATF